MRRRRGERGAAFIEAALILPVVVALALGTVEFGFAWRDVNQVERSLQSAGRTVTNLGTGRYADYEALQTVRAALEGMSGADIERVVIWEATSTNSDPPSGCTDSSLAPTSTSASGQSSPQRCNVYSPAQVASSSLSGFSGTSTCNAGSWDSFFCPTARDDQAPGLTYVGVFVRVRYTPFTSMIPSPTIDIERSTIYRVEPCVPIVSPC